MKQYTISLVLPALLIACNSAPTEPSVQKSLIIGDPVVFGTDHWLMFPIGSNYTPEVHDKPEPVNPEHSSVGFTYYQTSTDANGALHDRNADAEYVNVKTDEFDITNILFYNNATGESYPLTSKSLHILSFALHHEYKNSQIFFRIVTKDHNEDGKFDSEDPVMLYSSELDGDSLVQITPDDQKFIDYFYYANEQTILLKTIVDSDTSKTFSATDETNFMEMKLDSPAFAREIFSKDLKGMLKDQIGVK